MSLIDRVRNYVVAGKDKIVDGVHNYLELRRARKIVRQWEAMPTWTMGMNGTEYFNPAKYLLDKKTCDAMLTEALSRATW